MCGVVMTKEVYPSSQLREQMLTDALVILLHKFSPETPITIDPREATELSDLFNIVVEVADDDKVTYSLAANRDRPRM